MNNHLVTFRQVAVIPHDSQRVSRWTQRLYKILQTHNDSRDAEYLFRSFTAMATPQERRQLKTAYEVIRTAFMTAYDTAKAADYTPEPPVDRIVKWDSKKWSGDYPAYRSYAKHTAWLDTQCEVVR